MTIADFFDFLEAKAVQHADIPHDPANKKVAFYGLDDPYDLEEFDQALRNFAAFPAMLAELNEGELDDNDSANYTDTMMGGFMIVDKRRGKEPTRDVRHRCREIGKAIITQIRKDSRAGVVKPGEIVHMRINNVSYTPVGPLASQYYGYLFTFRFICPFSF
ncbi:MAG TPA: hypothetical protein VNQ80_15470 [Parapedobacter sp.]|uniref:hypothetical protein n=1 Tax=Parapedobacter sp. TaxID=1958893 RepID=UPI002CC90892|nr:hypothetical protein [Parapedobacter sp.]HWK58742.1 hypothetical protein [Parapedobacter sp.]